MEVAAVAGEVAVVGGVAASMAVGVVAAEGHHGTGAAAVEILVAIEGTAGVEEDGGSMVAFAGKRY